MKFNWGKGIALLYVLFILFMGTMVYKSTQQDLNLVTKDYYEKDLKYEDHRLKMVNTTAHSKKVEINHSSEKEILTFRFPEPEKKAAGTILFFQAI